MHYWAVILAGLAVAFWHLEGTSALAQHAPQGQTLVDYKGFPEGWDVRGKKERIPEVYQIKEQDNGRILSASVSGKSLRIFKKVSWNPFEYPILTWRWRVHRWPQEKEASIQFYVSLDRDLIGIPKIEKYVWSNTLPVGKERKGGFFSPYQKVIRSGSSDKGEWVTEHINVLEEFRKIHEADPAGQEAVGVGLLVSTGIEMEISEILALPEK